jgi:citrate synthase
LIDNVKMRSHLTAAEAAAELGISTASLYAYVSRGLIRSEPQPGSRAKLYLAADVRALRGRAPGAGSALPPATDAIATGMTLIHDGRLFYRSVNIEVLAQDARLESVATLLWGASDADPFAQAEGFAPSLAAPQDAGVISRLLIDLALASERDPAGYARSPDAIQRTGARIFRQALATIAGNAAAKPSAHIALAEAWRAPHAAELIRAALVVMADHELAASTYAVRVTASTGASPWRAISAGLACLDGPRHGGMAERVAALFDAIGSPGRAEAALAQRLKSGDSIPGFGHPLYPGMDPRCRVLLSLARKLALKSDVVKLGDAVIDAAGRLLGREPNLDFGLVVACRAAGLPADAPLSLFALARTVGWIGHVIEQSSSRTLIRPRAKYVGAVPS